MKFLVFLNVSYQKSLQICCQNVCKSLKTHPFETTEFEGCWYEGSQGTSRGPGPLRDVRRAKFEISDPLWPVTNCSKPYQAPNSWRNFQFIRHSSGSIAVQIQPSAVLSSLLLNIYSEQRLLFTESHRTPDFRLFSLNLGDKLPSILAFYWLFTSFPRRNLLDFELSDGGYSVIAISIVPVNPEVL